MPFLEANGERVYYELAGEGPGLVFLHSLGSSSHAWRMQVNHFSDGYRVLAPDRRGHGRSSHRGALTIDSAVDDLVALMDALGMEQAHICGLSMGGVEALRLYERHPERVSSLVLADTFAELPPDRARRRVEDLEERVRTLGMEAFGREYAYGTLLAGTSEEHKQELARVVGAMSPESYLAAAQACFSARLQHVLPTVRVPALVVVGAEDDRTPPSLGGEIARAIPGASLEVIPDAAHIANLDQPEAFNRVVRRFLQQAA